MRIFSFFVRWKKKENHFIAKVSLIQNGGILADLMPHRY